MEVFTWSVWLAYCRIKYISLPCQKVKSLRHIFIHSVPVKPNLFQCLIGKGQINLRCWKSLLTCRKNDKNSLWFQNRGMNWNFTKLTFNCQMLLSKFTSHRLCYFCCLAAKSCLTLCYLR